MSSISLLSAGAGTGVASGLRTYALNPCTVLPSQTPLFGSCQSMLSWFSAPQLPPPPSLSHHAPHSPWLLWLGQPISLGACSLELCPGFLLLMRTPTPGLLSPRSVSFVHLLHEASGQTFSCLVDIPSWISLGG